MPCLPSLKMNSIPRAAPMLPCPCCSHATHASGALVSGGNTPQSAVPPQSYLRINLWLTPACKTITFALHTHRVCTCKPINRPVIKGRDHWADQPSKVWTSQDTKWGIKKVTMLACLCVCVCVCVPVCVCLCVWLLACLCVCVSDAIQWQW